MIVSPVKGQQAIIWYRKENRNLPYHGKLCVVVLPGTGRPRNHLVDVDGTLVVVPCGNLKNR